MGSERAGNAKRPYRLGAAAIRRPYRDTSPACAGPNPFVGEKPVFSITRANLGMYADKLPEGRQGRCSQIPDYRMDVYPTHRTAAAPQWVYENIFRNATRAHAASAGIAYALKGPSAVFLSNPKNGFEWCGSSPAFWDRRVKPSRTYVISPNGTAELTTALPRDRRLSLLLSKCDADSLAAIFQDAASGRRSPVKVGEGYLAWQPIDTQRYKFRLGAFFQASTGCGRAHRSPMTPRTRMRRL